MVDKIGEEYDGMISSVTNFGLFVELPNTIEGLVHVSYLTDDYYRYDEHFAMIGERTGNVFRIGDEITIRVINVNKDERAIDFEIVGMKGTPRRFKDRPVVIEQPRTGRKKRGGRSERSNERVNAVQEESLTVAVKAKEKEKDQHQHPLPHLLASQGKRW